MAFSPRYSGTWKNRKGTVYPITIEADPWTDPVETIEFASVHFGFKAEKNELFFNLFPSTVTLVILPDENGISPVRSLIGAGERQYKIILDAGIVGTFEWWLKASQIAGPRDRPGPTTIVGAGGLNFLKDETYAQQLTPSLITYSGVDSLFDILERGLVSTGLSTDIISTWYDWYARSTGGFDATGLEALKHQGVDNEIFLDDDGNPFTMYEVFRNQVVAGCDLQVMNWAGQWWMLQRRRSFNAGTNLQDLFLTSTLATGAATIPFFLDIDWSNNFRLDGFIESHQQARVSSSITYNHKTPQTRIIGNPGFEDGAINDVGGNLVGEWRKAGSNATIGTIPGAGVDGSTAAYQDARLNTIAVVNIPDDFNTAHGNFFEQRAGLVEGGVGRKLTVSCKVQIDFLPETVPSTNVFYFGFKVSIIGASTTWQVFRDPADGLYKLSDTVSAPDDVLVFQWPYLISYATIQIPIDELHDGTDPTTGELYIAAYPAVQDNIGQGSAEFERSLFDDFDFTITEASGETANTATKTTCTDIASSNTNELQGPTVLFGSGPTSGHRGRIQVIDDLDAIDGDASDFQVGDDYMAPASGLTRDGLFCDERLKQSGIPPGQLRGRVLLDGNLDAYTPYMYL